MKKVYNYTKLVEAELIPDESIPELSYIIQSRQTSMSSKATESAAKDTQIYAVI